MKEYIRIDNFTKEQLKHFPPIPRWFGFTKEELSSPNFPRDLDDWSACGMYWIGEPDGSEGRWEICPDLDQPIFL